jgi:hypothetical protein
MPVNPSYLGGRAQEDHGLRLAHLRDPISKTTTTTTTKKTSQRKGWPSAHGIEKV